MGRRRHAHRRRRVGRQVPVEPVEGERGVLVRLEARYPARDGEPGGHADRERHLARRQVADEEHEHDGRGDVHVPEAQLPAVVETPRDVGVRLHGGLRNRVRRGSDDRAHDRAGDHQADRRENGQADIKKDGAEVAQRRQRDQRDHEADEAHERLDAGAEFRDLRQCAGERPGDAREGHQVECMARERERQSRDGERQQTDEGDQLARGRAPGGRCGGGEDGDAHEELPWT
ncbi:hypothetical protein BFJ63_vAg19774 [Fusarium oxysporum f. sp. narcissi]|uniref:Uncharacterized protein n=1 Tax=Fusarium oxysporum f. sp. narcissi TaxID=451672 RepID=A0A4Q2UT48_FUSOX|nr:hypothetical protein BFJ63_vAg19774 [Fusarium oxysporum f. sp. narcissi]